MNKTYLSLSKVKIYCEYILNGKPPILLIHGFVSSTHTFHRLIPFLREHYSIIAIDLPGFGRSEKSTSFVYTYSNYAELIIQCLDYFHIENVYIIGHSMGGQISLNVALKIPKRINKITLLASSGYLLPAKKWLIVASYLPFFDLVAKRHIKRNGVRETLQNVLFDPTLVTAELIEEYKRPISEKNFSKSLVRLLRHREGDLPSEKLNQVHLPILLLWGDNDRVVPLRVGKKLQKDLPNAVLKSYERTGHLITEERPKEIAEEILAFF